MTKRIFVNVSRGMTDKTAVCIFPWEKQLLEHIHGGEVEETTIAAMCALGDAVKVQKNAFKRADGEVSETAPTLKQQLEAMIVVPDDEDPLQDPEAEYSRLVDKYGMDKDMPLPVVSRVYGELNSGAFAAALKDTAKANAKPSGKSPDEMSINELRTELRRQSVDFDPTSTKEELRDLLATATA